MSEEESTAFVSPAPLDAEPTIQSRPKKVLLVDDSPYVTQTLQALFSFAVSRGLMTTDCVLVIVTNGGDAIRVFEAESPDIAIIDLSLPDMAGEDLWRELRERSPGMKGIVTSGYRSDPIIIHFERYGFVGALPKPIDPDRLISLMNEVLAEDPVEA